MSDPTKWPDLSRTRDALAVYLANAHTLAAQLDAAQTNADIAAWHLACDAALEPIRDAFYLDTQDRNSRGNVALMDYHDLLKMVQAWEASQEASNVR